jgi:hypothetical protein
MDINTSWPQQKVKKEDLEVILGKMKAKIA